MKLDWLEGTGEKGTTEVRRNDNEQLAMRCVELEAEVQRLSAALLENIVELRMKDVKGAPHRNLARSLAENAAAMDAEPALDSRSRNCPENK